MLQSHQCWSPTALHLQPSHWPSHSAAAAVFHNCPCLFAPHPVCRQVKGPVEALVRGLLSCTSSQVTLAEDLTEHQQRDLLLQQRRAGRAVKRRAGGGGGGGSDGEEGAGNEDITRQSRVKVCDVGFESGCQPGLSALTMYQNCTLDHMQITASCSTHDMCGTGGTTLHPLCPFYLIISSPLCLCDSTSVSQKDSALHCPVLLIHRPLLTAGWLTGPPLRCWQRWRRMTTVRPLRSLPHRCGSCSNAGG
jgi:hypothetical protein